MSLYIVATDREQFSISADTFDYHPETMAAVFRDSTGRTIALLTDVRHVCQDGALSRVTAARSPLTIGKTAQLLNEGVGSTQYDR